MAQIHSWSDPGVTFDSTSPTVCYILSWTPQGLLWSCCRDRWHLTLLYHREVPSRRPFGKSLRFRSARARLVPPAPPRRERPCVVVDLARCASTLVRPTGAPRGARTLAKPPPCFILRTVYTHKRYQQPESKIPLGAFQRLNTSRCGSLPYINSLNISQEQSGSKPASRASSRARMFSGYNHLNKLTFYKKPGTYG